MLVCSKLIGAHDRFFQLCLDGLGSDFELCVRVVGVVAGSVLGFICCGVIVCLFVGMSMGSWTVAMGAGQKLRSKSSLSAVHTARLNRELAAKGVFRL